MKLDEIKAMREEYEAAQDAAEAKREAYHSAIRRLYMSGISLREIAEQLGVSHQRVHKIVGLEPAKRKKRRIGAAVWLILCVITTGFFLLVSVGLGLATAVSWDDKYIHLPLKEGISDEAVDALKSRLESDSRVMRMLFYPSYQGSDPDGPGGTQKVPPFFFLQLRSVLDEEEIAFEYGNLPEIARYPWVSEWDPEGPIAVSLGAAIAAVGAAILSRRFFRNHFRPSSAGQPPPGRHHNRPSQ